MRVLTAAEIRGLESCAVESGVSMETLMENAGVAVAAAVTEKMDVTGKKTVILCVMVNLITMLAPISGMELF